MQKLTKAKATEVLDGLIHYHEIGQKAISATVKLCLGNGVRLAGLSKYSKELYITHGLPDLAEALGEELKSHERESWKIGFEYDGYFIFNTID